MADPKTADDLVEEGLRLYSRGQLDEALNQWRRALAERPGAARAQEYIQYVEANRAALERTFSQVEAEAGEEEGADGVEASKNGASGEFRSTAEPTRAPAADNGTVRRGGAARGGLLEQMNWGAVRPAGEHDDEAAWDQRAARSRLTTPVNLPEPAEDDLTPRVDVTEALLSGSKSPPLARESEHDSSVRKRPLMPVADQEGLRDFDSPEPTTGKLDGGGAPVQVSIGPVPQEALPPEPVLDELPTMRWSKEARTPTSMAEPSAASPVEGAPERDTTGFERSEQVTAAVLAGPLEAANLMPPAPPPPPVLDPLPALGGTSADAIKGEGAATDDGEPLVKRTTLPFGTPAAGSQAVSAALGPSAAPEEEGTEGMLEAARQLFEQGTFEGSLWACERVLAKDPASDEAQALLRRNQELLLEQYRERLVDLDLVPVVRIPQQEIVWHKLDHRAGFLLSRVDGVLSYSDILDISGMSDFEAFRILAQLLEQGVIGPSR
jgi:hypothetical protein